MTGDIYFISFTIPCESVLMTGVGALPHFLEEGSRYTRPRKQLPSVQAAGRGQIGPPGSCVGPSSHVIG